MSKEYNTKEVVSDKPCTVVSKDTIKRLVKDIKDLRKNPMEDDGIFYSHDDTNFLKGYAMIVGTQGSLYFGGYYFFYFDFPADYPYSPPKLTYSTNDGVTRFHPNLYKTGKVCLSILNTWKGESWSACQTIRSILLTLLTILDDKPLLHEPGFSEKSSDFKNYNKLILYKNVEFSILRTVSLNAEKYFPEHMITLFSDEIKSTFEKNKDKIYQEIEKYEDEEECSYSVSCYRMNQTINWKKICGQFKTEYIK